MEKKKLTTKEKRLLRACKLALWKLEQIGCYDNKEYFKIKNAVRRTEKGL